MRYFAVLLSISMLAGCSSLKTRHDVAALGSDVPDVEIVQIPVDPESPNDLPVDEGTKDEAAVVEGGAAPEEAETPTAKLDETKITLKNYPDVPHHYNRHVQQWLDYFQGKGQKHMRRYLERSTKYIPMMKKILRENGLPEDLVYIALIESGFGPSARSHAGAVGYWQFISETGRRYGMQINPLIDERKDPIKSTYAAVRYFRSLYNVFGNWYFAFAAYNGGENRMFRVLMKHDSRDFWTIAQARLLPRETVNYIPKYLAARMIARDPERYGFNDLEFSDEFQFSEVIASQTVHLRKLAEEMGYDYDLLKDLNQQFNTEYAPVFNNKSLSIRVPTGLVEKASIALANSYVTDPRVIASVKTTSDYSRYKVRRGDTLHRIARRHNTTISRIKSMNSLSSRGTIRVGQYLKVPDDYVGQQKKIINELRRSLKDSRTAKKEPRSSRTVKKQFIVVRRGDTLTEIAQRYNVSLSRILAANDLNRKSKINAGRRLVIPD